MNYQVVAQNIRVADVLTHNQRSNNDHSEPQVRSLPHVVRRTVDSDDVATTRQGLNAENHGRHNVLLNPVHTNIRRANDVRRHALCRASETAQNAAIRRFLDTANNDAIVRAMERDVARAVRQRN